MRFSSRRRTNCGLAGLPGLQRSTVNAFPPFIPMAQDAPALPWLNLALPRTSTPAGWRTRCAPCRGTLLPRPRPPCECSAPGPATLAAWLTGNWGAGSSTVAPNGTGFPGKRSSGPPAAPRIRFGSTGWTGLWPEGRRPSASSVRRCCPVLSDKNRRLKLRQGTRA